MDLDGPDYIDPEKIRVALAEWSDGPDHKPFDNPRKNNYGMVLKGPFKNSEAGGILNLVCNQKGINKVLIFNNKKGLEKSFKERLIILEQKNANIFYVGPINHCGRIPVISFGFIMNVEDNNSIEGGENF